jgi:DNA-binding HxlR family transcriptional regulator
MSPPRDEPRSACPITCALDLLGDRWTLVILRDLLLAGQRSFSDFARPEGIATNILTDRLTRLEVAGVLERKRDPSDGRRRIYTPTERGIALIPVLLELSIWGFDHAGGTAKPELVEAARRDRGVLEQMLRERLEQTT